MKKSITLMSLVSLVLTIGLLAGCSKATDKNITAKCNNGKFVGSYEEETGILSFKGIPYAKAPVGELRWKAPVPCDDSKDIINATEFGKSSIQYEWHSEPITTERSEDCLTLNIWTKDLKGKDKPVMVFFHGGSFAWGGTSEELYNGQYIVKEHDDVIVVTCNYRVGVMGFIDLSGIEGGENFPDSKELGMLDAVESLKWIKKNISAFGGNPDNITIFGESAGSTMVMGLLASDLTEGLFNRVIAESGSYNLLFSANDYSESSQGKMLLLATGASNMDELMALSEEELIEANELSLDEDEMTVNDYYSLPLRGGKVIPEDPYAALANAKKRGIDVIIGTNRNEIAYWVAEMGEVPMKEMDEDGVAENLELYEENFINVMYEEIMETISEDETAYIEEYLNNYNNLEDVWAKTNLLTEALFRAASLKAAETYSNAEGSGKIYMYLFEKENTDFDFIGACHASELAYVFRNTHETDFSGTVDENLSNNICQMWVNFAKDGNPSIDGVTWSEYDTNNRNTMVFGNDCSLQLVSDPYKVDRELTEFLADYYIWAAGA